MLLSSLFPLFIHKPEIPITELQTKNYKPQKGSFQGSICFNVFVVGVNVSAGTTASWVYC